MKDEGEIVVPRPDRRVDAVPTELLKMVEWVSVARLEPDDIVVLKVKARLSHDQIESLRRMVKEVFGQDRRVAILDVSVDIAFVSEELEGDPLPDPSFCRRLSKEEFPANLTGS